MQLVHYACTRKQFHVGYWRALSVDFHSPIAAYSIEGRYPWRTSSGVTRQSLAENAVSRFKALVGMKLASRELERPRIEVLVKSPVLDWMSALGMPRSERIVLG